MEVQKWALFNEGKKKVNLICDSKRSSFIKYLFELQFDTTTLIIPSFRMIKARCYKGSNLTYVKDLIRETITEYYTGSSITAAVVLTYT